MQFKNIPAWKVVFLHHLAYLLLNDLYPSGPRLSQVLHSSKRGLNGRECALRTRLFKALGLKKAPNPQLPANAPRHTATRQKARRSAAPAP